MAVRCCPWHSRQGIVMPGGDRFDSIELFGGCGGLGLGLARAGFRSREFWEWDRDAVLTVRHNVAAGVRHVADWHVVHDDVRHAKWSEWLDRLDLISGGPPCQAFAIGGKKRGSDDPRDMWPQAIRAVREARPRAFLFENVRNLAGPSFAGYLEWITRSLRHVSVPRDPDEDHADHLRRLRAVRGGEYQVTVHVVNAADFGAAQERKRVLVAGLRTDLGLDPTEMRPTHGRDRLLWDQWVTGEYWDRHGLRRPRDDAIPATHRAVVSRLRDQIMQPPERPWLTLRDVIHDLGTPDGRNNHVFQPGARSYKGHTGSPLDWPAKALKAGDHGVPGGENMIRFADGSVRYLTLRETARLVGMPDEFTFPVSWTESMRQLGNAVPAQLAEAGGRWIAGNLHRARNVTQPRAA